MRTLISTGSISLKGKNAPEDRHPGFKPDYCSLRYAAQHVGSEMREPYALKGARTVPGRGEDGDIFSLFDYYLRIDALSDRLFE